MKFLVKMIFAVCALVGVVTNDITIVIYGIGLLISDEISDLASDIRNMKNG